MKRNSDIYVIAGDKNSGVKIDWGRVIKEYKKLKCPEDCFNPFHVDLDENGIIATLSPRAYGKTTAWLLVGLIIYKMYGMQMTYTRQSKVDIEPKHIRELYSVVLAWDYIPKIFGSDSWNGIEYRAQKWTLVKKDENGEIIEKDTKFCTYCESVDRAFSIKSTLNLPDCSLIVYDEFISNRYLYNEAIDFFDLVKTIFRERINGNVVLLANTIDKNSQYFDELCVRDTIDGMGSGDIVSVETSLQTKISIELISLNIHRRRAFMNKRFFGFPNPKFAAITGADVWAVDLYQHIPFEDEDHPTESVFNRVFIRHAGKYVKLHLVRNPQIGLCVYVTPATRTYDDSIILSTDETYDRNHIWGLGGKVLPVLAIIWQLYGQNRFYYARNSEGAYVKSYVDKVLKAASEKHIGAR